MSTIRFIDISENPFECVCDFKWMVTWLRNSSDVVQENDATCSPALENKLRGKLLSTIDPSDLCDTHLKPYWLFFFNCDHVNHHNISYRLPKEVGATIQIIPSEVSYFRV